MTETYTSRRENLSLLGFASYGDYLTSELWLGIRVKVIPEGTLCKTCGKRPAKQVHHQSYSLDVLNGLNLAALIPVCGGCHMRIEFTGSKVKRSLQGSITQCEQMLVKLKGMTSSLGRCSQCGWRLNSKRKESGERMCSWCQSGGPTGPKPRPVHRRKRRKKDKSIPCRKCQIYRLNPPRDTNGRPLGVLQCKWCITGKTPPKPGFKKTTKGKRREANWEKKFGNLSPPAPQKLVTIIPLVRPVFRLKSSKESS